ncbi:MAG: ATP-binding protein [Gemmatimonadota bacterium]
MPSETPDRAKLPPSAARPRRGLLAKYVTYAALLVSALLVTSGVIGGYFSWRETAATQGALLSGHAEAVAVRIANFVASIEQPIAWTADSATLDSETDPAQVRLALIELLRRVPAIGELRWLDTQGRERVLVSRLALDALDSGRDFSTDARFGAAVASGRYVSPVYFVKGTEPHLSLAIAGRRPGSGVLIAEVNLKFVWDVIGRERAGGPGLAYVVDAGGQLVSHPDISLVLRRADFSTLEQVRGVLAGRATASDTTQIVSDFGGTSVLAAAAPVEGLGWTVLVEQQARDALAPVYRSVWRTLILVLVGLAVSIAASVALARRMVHPIRALERGAERIGSGALDQRIDVRTGDELEALADQFNRMAARLQDIYATLETRIAERTRQLAAANQYKSRFLAAASHDLRQPLHALALFAGQLRQAAADAPACAALAQRIDASVIALQELLDALLDLSKAEAGAIVPERTAFALQPLLQRLSAHFTATAEAKGLALRVVPTSLWVDSDPRLLERILLNFVANAVRYTDEGRIAIGCRRRGTHAEIIVADTGIGIAEEHLSRIFDEFHQVRDRADGRGGLGLGLSIVQRLAQLLNHPLSVWSSPGRGSVFGVRVPIAPAHATQPDAVAGGDRELAGRCALVIDDDADAREATMEALSRWGCSVTGTGDRDSALQASAAAPPDIILCDLHLGTESGLDVLDALRERCASAPACVVVTADRAAEAASAVRARGYVMLHKPAAAAKLRALLEQLLAERATL